MDAFIGKWEHVECENFDAYMKQIGVGMIQRKMAGALKPTITYEKNGNKWKITVASSVKNTVTEFELDVEFEETTPDGRKAKSTFHFENGKLIQIQKSDKDSRFERWIEGDHLITTGECEGVKYKRVNKRV
ncbi:hypothetical protein FO519_006895 [Halicephalobus sp. NKZ332]|nr:hypothetical protein FO519_006895 [Halicephalobus sp. NKZ332]